MKAPNKQQQRTVKPVTQIAAQLRASFASRCSGRCGKIWRCVMNDTWDTVFEDKVDGRDVRGEVYSEGGYKVSTTQKSDYDGKLSSDEGSLTIIPPSGAGTAIEIHADTLEELERDLVDDGEFSSDETREITKKFNA